MRRPVHLVLSRGILLVSAALTTGCRTQVNVEKEKAAIAAINETIRQAHFDHDAAKFLAHNAQEWYSVRDGSVSRRNKEQYQKGLDEYLKSMDFTEVTDVAPSKIRISEDGSMAWLIGNVRVKGKQKQPNGGQVDVDFVSAWLAVYEKQGSDWYLVAHSNTERKN